MPTGWERREVPCGDIGSDTSMWHVARHAASSVLMQRERNRWGPSSYPDARPTVRQASGQRMGGRRVCTTRLDPTAALPSSPRSPSPPSGPQAVGGSRSDQLAARSDEEDEVSCRPPVSPLPRRPRTRDPARYPRTARHRRGTRAWMIRSRPGGADGALRMRRSAAIATHAVHTTSRATSRRHESHLARAKPGCVKRDPPASIRGGARDPWSLIGECVASLSCRRVLSVPRAPHTTPPERDAAPWRRPWPARRGR